MEEIERELLKIAEEIQLVLGGDVTVEACQELVLSTYRNMRQQYGEQMELMEPSAIAAVLRKQMGELVRMGRAKKLLAKRKNIEIHPD